MSIPIAGHQAMLAGGKKLPYDAEVQWIKSGSEATYIDFGIVFNATMTLRGTIGADTYNTRNCCFGARIANTSANWFGFNFERYNSSSRNFWWGRNRNFNVNRVEVDGALPSYVSVETTPTSWTINETTVASNRADVTGAQTIRIMFCTVKSVEIIDNGVIVLLAKPVRFTNELGNSEGAMYDSVTNQLFRATGGTVTIGPDKA